MYLLFLLLLLGSFVHGEKHDKQNCGPKDSPMKVMQCGWKYLLYAPHIFRSGMKEKIMFMTYNVPFPVNVDVKFYSKSYRTEAKLVASASMKGIKAGSLTEIMLEIPVDEKVRSGFLTVKGSGSSSEPFGEWNFANKTGDYRISFEKKGNSVFIQTDRPLYKPGETIKMRVLSVDPQLQAVKGKISSLNIENPAGSRMFQWKDQPLKNGFASFKFPLSTKPVLGEWKINAVVEGVKKSIKIEVKKYVLPKFQVKILPPKYIVRGQEKIQGQICAKYSYGKPVIGKLNAKFCLRRGGYYYYRRNNLKRESCVMLKNQRVTGCYDFEIDASELQMNKGKYYYSNHRFIVTASVKESATGISQNATQTETVISMKLVVLSFEGDRNLKPGLPFALKIKAKYPDGTPIKNLKVNAHMAYRGKVKFNDVVEIKNGIGNFKIPQIDFFATDISFKATFKRPRNPRLEYDPKYNQISTARLNIDPWYSPTHSYLKIEKPEGELEVGKEVPLKVYYTSTESFSSTKTLHYSVICKGNVVTFESKGQPFKPGVPVEIVSKPTTTLPPTTERSNNTTTPPFTIRIRHPWLPHWKEIPATRPPFPKEYTVNHFNILLKIKQEMVPSCRMLVYYLRGEEVVADNVDLDIKDQFANQVHMKFGDKEVRPGETTTLNLKAAPGSVFAFAAVDKSIHFLRKGNELTPPKLMAVLNSLDVRPTYTSNHWSRCSSYKRKKRGIVPYYQSSSYSDSEKAFAGTGSVFLSNLLIDARPCSDQPIALPMVLGTGRGTGDGVVDADGINTQQNRKTVGTERSGRKKGSSAPRTDFRETWLWSEEVVDMVTGEKKLQVKVPDTITSWYASGFAVSDSAGLGVASPVELKTFKPFFVSLALPYAVIRGEDVTLPAAVFNYKKKCISVEVTLKRSKSFRLLTAPRATACICGGRTATVLFRVRPFALGIAPIEVSATTLANNICKESSETEAYFSSVDTVIKKLRIEPEGVEQENVHNFLICPKDSNKGFKTTVDLRVPDNTVAGSIFSEVSVIGDLMGPSLSNIDELLAMPYGCGEQNMLKFAPNIFIMQYLNSTSQLTPAIESKAKNYMLTGYQRELTYKHKDGSYSAFGEGRGKGGSMWLTAFVLKSFAQARPFLTIDKKDLTDSIRWIKKHQDPNGCFPTVGLLHNKLMKGGVKSPVTLTAYVLIALLEADVSVKSSTIKAAVGCISPYLNKVNDSYSLTILAYALAKGKFEQDLKIVLKKLEEKAVDKDGLKHWEAKKESDAEDNRGWWYSRPASSGDIEMTAYALLAHLEARGKDGVGDVLPIVRWLTKQRNSLGGWSSTQDTVLAMQALAKYAGYMYGASLQMKISVASTGGFKETFNVNQDNSLILQKSQIERVPTRLGVKATGKGCSLLQISTKYNIDLVKEKPSFEVTVSVSSVKSNTILKYGKCYSQKLRVCARWLRKGISNMAIMNVRMVSGFVPNKDSLKKAMFLNKNLKDFEVEGRDLVLYYSKIIRECVTVQVDQNFIVGSTKPVPVTVYDYYDKDKKGTEMYEISKRLCQGKA